MSSNDTEKEDTTIYKVVMNDEEQYSIWPAYKGVPGGWKPVGKPGHKAECLAYIKEVWTDMRPLSLRKKMEEFAKNPPPPQRPANLNTAGDKNLVDQLCEGFHVIEMGLRTERSATRLKEAIDHNYVHIKFTRTKGGTELGFHLDRDASNLKQADFENCKGTVHFEGDLTLDYVRVRCFADLDLSTFEGTAHLVKIKAKEIGVASVEQE